MPDGALRRTGWHAPASVGQPGFCGLLVERLHAVLAEGGTFPGVAYDVVQVLGGVRYSNVTCDNCERRLTPVGPELDTPGLWKYLQAQGALHVSLAGGYDEFVDMMEDDPAMDLLLCQECATMLAQAFPAVRKAVLRHLNLNVGHVCLDDVLYWEPMPSCSRDPLRHGWLSAWVVRGPYARLSGAPRSRPVGPTLVYALALDEASAEASAERLRAVRPDLDVATGSLLFSYVEDGSSYVRPDGTPVSDFTVFEDFPALDPALDPA